MVHDLSGYSKKRPQMLVSAQSGWAPKQAQVCLPEWIGHGSCDISGAIMKGYGRIAVIIRHLSRKSLSEE